MLKKFFFVMLALAYIITVSAGCPGPKDATKPSGENKNNESIPADVPSPVDEHAGHDHQHGDDHEHTPGDGHDHGLDVAPSTSEEG